MLNVTITGLDKVVSKYEQMPNKIHDGVFRAVTKLALMLEGYVKTQKLSGQVLNKQTGRLMSSIHNDITDQGTSIIGRVFSAQPMPYAAIHEFGFSGSETVRAHIRTMVFGREVGPFTVPSFTRQMNMPERSFMRSSLKENEQRIIQDINTAVDKAVHQ